MPSSRLNELSLTQASHLIQSDSIQPQELLADCVSQIERCQDQLAAFTTFDAERVFDELKKQEKRQLKSPLWGIPVGIKDIMETAGMRTTMGSRIYRKYVPQRDATCVAMLKTAGAIIAGKTETTEFAYYSPGRTRNPHATNHTPGGSSMGSAVAVSQHMVPLALGTQTAGSVIRPAAYCGVTGYKASHGTVSLAGVFGFAQSLDTIGFFVRKVNDLTVVRHTLLGTPVELPNLPQPIRIGFVKTPHWQMADADQRQLLEQVCDYLADKQFAIDEIEVESEDQSLTQAQMKIMAYEGCRSLCAEYVMHSDKMSEQIKALIKLGHETSFDAYQEAQKISATWRENLQQIFHQYDALITPSAPGEAPRGLDSTGDPIFNRIWTLLKVPCIHLPVGLGYNGLPLGIQLIGPYHQDDRLINVAHQVEKQLADFNFEVAINH